MKFNIFTLSQGIKTNLTTGLKIGASFGLAAGIALSSSYALASANAHKHVDPWTSAEWLQVMRDMPKGDIKRGEELANKGYCYSCHGVEGLNPTQATPSLAGQNATYIYKMLLDYKSGLFYVDHKSDVMIDLMQTYGKQQMSDLAAYYEAQTLPQAVYKAQTSAANESTIKLIRKGDVSRLIVPCASCHGAKGEGGMNESPALTGLSPRMFIRHMKAYRSGERKNDVNSGMAQFAENLTDEEITALADYYSSLVSK